MPLPSALAYMRIIWYSCTGGIRFRMPPVNLGSAKPAPEYNTAGGMYMNYPVLLGEQKVGQVQVTRKGLYYHFSCHCRLESEKIYRLYVSCGSENLNLGVPIPCQGDFQLETQIPIKRLGDGEMSFQLRTPNEQQKNSKFCPIYPEEPFAYITRLKNAHLVRQNGQKGILLTE